MGITIGIFAIIAVFTAVDSLERKLRESVASLGDNVIFVQKWPWTFGPDYPWWKYMNRPLPKPEELVELDKKTVSAEASAFQVAARKTLQSRLAVVENVSVVGVSHNYEKVKSLDIVVGRYFTESESSAGRPVAILGDAVAKALFRTADPVGKSIKAFGRNLTVIGVLKKEGESILGGSGDSQIIVPVNFVRGLIDIRSENADPLIMVKAKPGITNEQLIDELTGIMRSVRRLRPSADDDFALNQTDLISKEFDELFKIVGLAGALIGGFSILVGGFGIANIMFVSVRERTNQIGIQKALGAKKSFILLQFLVESIVLSLIGGLVGLFLVFILSVGASLIFDWDFSMSLKNILTGIILSGSIGVIAGFIPAYIASKLDPVEAIRMN